MAEKRKLQQEIDKTLKRVEEGISEFNDIYAKVHGALNPTQKEKLENELKREIKKLQRYREQIKGWQTSSDIKNKGPLEEARRKIEKEMERFKVCEREFKMKAFSREGLAAKAKVDPHEEERAKHREWVNNTIHNLMNAVDAYEAELEVLSTKKSRNIDSDRVNNLKTWVQQHQWHLQKLELILRRLDNYSVDFKMLDDIKDMVEHYEESHENLNFYFDEEMYADMNLEENDDGGEGIMERDDDDEIMGASESVDEEILQDFATGSAAGKNQTDIKKLDDSSKIFSQTSSSSSSLSAIDSPNVSGEPIIQFSTYKSVETDTSQPFKDAKEANVSGLIFSNSNTGHINLDVDENAEHLKHSELPSESSNYLSEQSSLTGKSDSGRGIKAYTSVTHSSSSLTKPSAPHSFNSKNAKTQSSPYSVRSTTPVHTSSASSGRESLGSTIVDTTQLSDTAANSLPLLVGSTSSNTNSKKNSESHQFFGEVSEATGETVEQKTERHGNSELKSKTGKINSKTRSSSNEADMNAILKLVDTSYRNCPTRQDGNRNRCQSNKTQWLNPIPSFPTAPLATSDSPQFFSNYEVDTLFFIFYHQQGTLQQYLAAKELKKQSWRFHKKFITWFQRHKEPELTTESYEKGSYLFFDYNTEWAQRVKLDFTFEYVYLEDELT